mmetsp:Transcript_691/g.2394  ORF Transcript_691/g.2394 Transcript_691/m.2394 type:complete len:873 (+) Transcript_691:72-2690(+)
MRSLALALLLLARAHAIEQRYPSHDHYSDTVGMVNFQGDEPCLSKPKVVAVSSLPEMSAIVSRHKSVKAVGAGMSWSRNQIGCAASGGANIITAGLCEKPELTATMPFYLAPPLGTARIETADIRVDEAGLTVTVMSCVTIQALLEFLAAYRTNNAPGGYMLPYPSTSFAGQTVGGAVSTATYGASLVHGSWSAKVLEISYMNAKGELVRGITAATQPLLFKALKTSGGRLGVVIDVKLAIERQRSVELRHEQDLDMGLFLREVRQTAQHVKVAMGLRDPPASCEGQLPCAQYDQNLRAVSNQLHAASLEKANVRLIVEEGRPPSISMSIATLGQEGSFEPQANPNEARKERNRLDWLAYLEGTFFASPNAAHTWADALKQSPLAGAHLWKRLANPDGDSPNMWYADPKSCLSESSARTDLPVLATLLQSNIDYLDRIEQSPEMYHRWTDLIKGSACYNTTSLGVTYDKAADCLVALTPVLHHLLNDHRKKVTIRLRFTGVDDSFISPMGRTPRMWFEMDTFHGEDIPSDMIEVLRGERCSASLSWSAHGLGGSWVDPKAPRNSTVEQLGPDWCSFGCVAMQHDPTGKFEGHGWARETWTFSAYDPISHRIINGEAFQEHCCTTPEDGSESSFDTSRCICAANIREDSEKAQMACHLMKNDEFRGMYCPLPGGLKDWTLMSGCDWKAFKDAHHALGIPTGANMPDGCNRAPPSPSPPPFVKPPPPDPPIPPSPPPPPPPNPSPPHPQPVLVASTILRQNPELSDEIDLLDEPEEHALSPVLRVTAILVSLVLELLCLWRLWLCFCPRANDGHLKIAGTPDDALTELEEAEEEEEEYHDEEYDEEYVEEEEGQQYSHGQRTNNDKDPGETVLD